MFSCNGILYSYESEQSTAATKNMDESQKDNVDKRSWMEKYILCDSTLHKVQNSVKLVSSVPTCMYVGLHSFGNVLKCQLIGSNGWFFTFFYNFYIILNINDVLLL